MEKLRAHVASEGGRMKAAMSVEEAGEEAGVGRSFIFEEIKSGRLIARKAGRRTLVMAEDFTAWLRSLPTTARAAR